MQVWYTGTFQTLESKVSGESMEIDKPDHEANHLNIPRIFQRGFGPQYAVTITIEQYKQKYTSPPNKKGEYKERFEEDLLWIVSRARGSAWKIQVTGAEAADKQIKAVLKQKKVRVGKDGFLERSDV